MWNFLTILKSKLLLIGGAAIGFLLLYISVLKRAALQKEVNLSNSKSKQKDAANKAAMEGLQNEAKPAKRGYFDDSRLRK